MKKYERICPKCNNIIIYTLKSSLTRAIKNNSVCKNGGCHALKDVPYEKNKKWCNRCKTNKPFSLFYNNAIRKNKLSAYCISCDKQNTQKYRLNNTEKYKERDKTYHHLNKEKRNQYNRQWNFKHKGYASQKSKAWRQKNKKRARYLDRKNDRIRRARKNNLNDNKYTINEERFTFEYFNNQCFNCDTKKDLTIDHHLPLSKGHILSINNAVVLCRSCNSSKGAKDPKDFYSIKKYKQINKKLKACTLLYQQ